MPESSNNNLSDNHQTNWLQRLIQRFSQRPQGDVIAAQIGEDARNVVVGKNVIQIGTLQIPFYLAVIIAAGVVLITLSTAVIAFSSSGAASLLGKPARMTGLFNIAVANFGELDANGHVHASEDGRRLSEWLYEALQTEYTKNPDLARLVNVEIWHGTPGLFGRTIEFGVLQDETATHQLADKVNAHVVIYGNVNPESEPPGLELKFYIAPQLRSEASSVIGSYSMGQPIPVKLPFDPKDPVGNIATGDSLSTRSAALSLLTIGLTYELAGKYQKAYDLFQQAEATLADLEPGNGQEIPYFFMGREALFLKKDQDAETAFGQALTASNQQYARAQIGLGSVYLFRAQNAKPEQRQAALNDLAQAITNYEKGVELAKQTQEPLVENIAQLALATALRVQGQMDYQADDYANANKAYDKAIALLTPLLDPLATAQQYRFLAQAYQSLGAAYVQQADVYRLQKNLAGRKTRLEQASTAFASCIEQGKVASFDEILRTKIIGAPQNGCQPQLDAVNKALQESGG
jgi:tetratricopeptide (TPR) repeat protein